MGRIILQHHSGLITFSFPREVPHLFFSGSESGMEDFNLLSIGAEFGVVDFNLVFTGTESGLEEFNLSLAGSQFSSHFWKTCHREGFQTQFSL